MKYRQKPLSTTNSSPNPAACDNASQGAWYQARRMLVHYQFRRTHGIW